MGISGISSHCNNIMLRVFDYFGDKTNELQGPIKFSNLDKMACNFTIDPALPGARAMDGGMLENDVLFAQPRKSTTRPRTGSDGPFTAPSNHQTALRLGDKDHFVGPTLYQRDRIFARHAGVSSSNLVPSLIDEGEDSATEPDQETVEDAISKMAYLSRKTSSSRTATTPITLKEDQAAWPQKVSKSARKARNGYRPVSEIDDKDEEGDRKRQKFLERNRAAAMKCRRKRRDFEESLAVRARELSQSNAELKACVDSLRDEVLELKDQYLQHAHCASGSVGTHSVPGFAGQPTSLPESIPCPDEGRWLSGAFPQPVYPQVRRPDEGNHHASGEV
jgi:hypothetical protein